MVERGERGERDRRERERGERSCSRGPHFNLCSFVGLFNMPVTCRCHASTCRPSSDNYLPPYPLPLHPPLPWQHKSQSILHNAMRAWLNGGVAPAPLPTTLCIPHTKHAATFLASSRCVCICPTVRHNVQRGDTKLFMLHLSCCCTAAGGKVLPLYRECIRVNPPSYSAFALYVSCLRKHSNCLPYERRRTWKAKRKL